MCKAECDISVSKLLGFETFPMVLMVSVSDSKNFGIEKSIGIGFEKFWYRKKYRYRFRKNLVSKKVSVSVSEKIGIGKSIGFGIEKIWYRKKVSDSVSFRFWVSSHTEVQGNFYYRGILLYNVHIVQWYNKVKVC